MDLAQFIPLIIALVGGGAVAIYTARPRKDSIIAEASEKAVEVVSRAIGRLESDLAVARSRIEALEAELRLTRETAARFEERIYLLKAEVTRLGGDVERLNKDPNG
jgi:chromosome segregation ATPase